MLVWQGLGAYGLIIPFFLWFGLQLAISAVAGAQALRDHGQLIGGVTLVASAGLLEFLQRWIVRSRPSRTLVDQATGEKVVLASKHTMFFIPLRAWAVLYAVVGVLLVLAWAT